MIEITHTRTDGTLVTGTQRGDGVGPAMKACHFRWSRNLGAWYLPHSRDGRADTYRINQLADALRRDGFEVTVTIDNTTPGRAFAEAEADRNEQAAARAERYADRSDRAAVTSNALYDQARERASRIPFGQPILIGHDSENRDRRDRERIRRTFEKSFEEDKRARHWGTRADAAARYQEHREDIPRTLRRIERLKAERGRWERRLQAEAAPVDAGQGYAEPTGDHREAETEIDALTEQIDHWTAHVEQAKAAGVKVWGPDDFTKGDYVHHHGRWFEVVRRNQKTLSVPPLVSDAGAVVVIDGKTARVIRQEGNRLTWTHLLPYDDVSGRMSADDMAAALAAVDGISSN